MLNQIFKLFLLAALLITSSFAQIDLEGKKKKIDQRIKNKKQKTEEKIDEKIDEAIENIFNEVEKTVDGTIKEDSPADTGSETSGLEDTNINETTVDSEAVPAGINEELKVWSNYDFVPGDKIIFFDNLENEKDGEFPSKWDLISGNAENAKFGEDNVIAFMKNKTEVAHLHKTKDYLPEVFTIEFDVYFHNKVNEAYYLNLKGLTQIDIRTNKVSLGNYEGVPGEGSSLTGWHHIALSFNKRSLKVYFDHSRVLNIPNIEKKPTAFTISALSHGAARGIPAMIKNIRVAGGGIELYDRLITDGRIITTGIYFDTGTAEIKPESMGVINEIAALMTSHPEINFIIEGHTDSDGDENSNIALSEKRSASVKNLLISLGINSTRLSTKGFGENKPVTGNSSPEEKAVNRRVEFVKI